MPLVARKLAAFILKYTKSGGTADPHSTCQLFHAGPRALTDVEPSISGSKRLGSSKGL